MYKIVSDVPSGHESSRKASAVTTSTVKFEPRLYVGSDAADHFLDSLQRDLHELIMSIIDNVVEMIFDSVDRQRYESATRCHICEKPITPDGDEITVRDHCNFSGAFWGAAHNSCNLVYGINAKRYKLPILFQNLRGS